MKCEKCGLRLGEVENGKVRLRSVMLCGGCWAKAEAAMGMAEAARAGTPKFLEDLMRGFDDGLKGRNTGDEEGEGRD